MVRLKKVWQVVNLYILWILFFGSLVLMAYDRSGTLTDVLIYVVVALAWLLYLITSKFWEIVDMTETESDTRQAIGVTAVVCLLWPLIFIAMTVSIPFLGHSKETRSSNQLQLFEA